MTDRIIGFIDILGFKEIVYNNPPDELRTIYRRFIDCINLGITNAQFKVEDGILKPNLDSVDVNSLLISDSAALWSNDNELKDYFKILAAMRTIISQGIIDGLPLRGYLTVGQVEFTVSQLPTPNTNQIATIYGKGFVDAYIGCDNQKWSGAMLSESYVNGYSEALLRYKIKNAIPDFGLRQLRVDFESLIQDRKFIREYKVITKNTTDDKYAINWVNEINVHNIQNIFDSFYKYNKIFINSSNIKSSITEKIVNTIEFYNYIKNQE